MQYQSEWEKIKAEYVIHESLDLNREMSAFEEAPQQDANKSQEEEKVKQPPEPKRPLRLKESLVLTPGYFRDFKADKDARYLLSKLHFRNSKIAVVIIPKDNACAKEGLTMVFIGLSGKLEYIQFSSDQIKDLFAEELLAPEIYLGSDAEDEQAQQ